MKVRVLRSALHDLASGREFYNQAQTKLFSGYTNFEYFGGEDKFRQMLARASAAVGAPGN